MNVLVDAFVWSLAVRRDAPPDVPEVGELRRFLEEGAAVCTSGTSASLHQAKGSSSNCGAFPGIDLFVLHAPPSVEDYVINPEGAPPDFNLKDDNFVLAAALF